MKKILFPYTLFYLFKEILPTFLIGLFILPVILLAIDTSHLIEFFINYKVSLSIILKIFMYIFLKFLPYTIFVNILISPLIAYSRLKMSNEIFALQSLGTPKWVIALPYFLLSIISSVAVFYSLFYWSPSGFLYYNKVIDDIEERAIAVKMKEGSFIDNFSDTVIFVNKIEKTANELKEIFIYDERSPKQPITIIAKKGRFFIKKNDKGSKVQLILENGTAYSDSYMKSWMKFNTYEFYLFMPFLEKKPNSSLEALNYKEIHNQLRKKEIPHERKYFTKMELYKRWNFVFIPILLFLLAFSIILHFSPRSRHWDSIGLSLIVIGCYWALQIIVEALVRSQTHFPFLLYLLCLPNLIFLALSLFIYKKSS